MTDPIEEQEQEQEPLPQPAPAHGPFFYVFWGVVCGGVALWLLGQGLAAAGAFLDGRHAAQRAAAAETETNAP